MTKTITATVESMNGDCRRSEVTILWEKGSQSRGYIKNLKTRNHFFPVILLSYREDVWAVESHSRTIESIIHDAARSCRENPDYVDERVVQEMKRQKETEAAEAAKRKEEDAERARIALRRTEIRQQFKGTRFKKALIDIAVTEDGEDKIVPVPGHILGQWGFHKPDDKEKTYVITFLPLGLSAGSVYNLADARLFCARMHDKHPNLPADLSEVSKQVRALALHMLREGADAPDPEGE